jgi:hypothetical protein
MCFHPVSSAVPLMKSRTSSLSSEPRKGDWSLIRRHIEDVLAGGNGEAGDYLIRWIAWAIQNPARQAEAAVVLIGAKGTGRERWSGV